MKTRNCFTLVGALLTVLTPCLNRAVQAAPLFQEPQALAEGKLKNPTRASLLRDDEDPGKIWVVPRSIGAVENLGRMKNGDLDQAFVQKTCQAMQTLQEKSRQLQGEKINLSSDVDALVCRIDAAHREAESFELEISIKECERRDFEERFFDLKAGFFKKERLVESLQERWEIECAGTRASCDALERQIKEAQAYSTELKAAMDCLRNELDGIDWSIEVLEGKISGIWATLDEYRKEIRSRQEAVIEKERELLEMYQSYARQPGDRVRFRYRSGIDEDLEQLAQANPDFAFKAVKGHKVRLHANMIPEMPLDDYLTRLPAVLGFEIDGRKFTSASLAFERLPNSFEGIMQLSMIGTCPGPKGPGGDSIDDIKEDNLVGTLASYEFDVSGDFAFTMSYDENEVRKYLAKRWMGVGVARAMEIRTVAKELLRLDYFDFQIADASLSEFQVNRLKERQVSRVIEQVTVAYGVATIHNISLNWNRAIGSGGAPQPIGSILFQWLKESGGRVFDVHWRVSEPSEQEDEPRPVRWDSSRDKFPVSASVTYLP